MTVRVTIPIRLRVDPGALTRCQADLEEALSAAIGRALANSRETVLEPRGGYMGVRMHPPEFTWSGDGLGAIAAATRTEIETLLQHVLEETTQTQRIYQFARAGDEAPAPLMAQAAEPLDRDRHASLLGAYAVPAYDNQGIHRAVAIAAGDEMVRIPGAERDYYVWRTVHDLDQLSEYFAAELDLQERTLPANGYLGAIFQGANGKKQFRISRLPQDTLVAHIEITNPTRPAVQRHGGTTRFVIEGVPLLPTSRYRVSWYANAESHDQILEVLRRFHAPSIERVILANAQRLPGTTTADIQQQLPPRIDALLTEMARDYQGIDRITFLQFYIDGTPYLLGVRGNSLPNDLDAELIPLIDIRTRSRRRGRGSSTAASPSAPAAPAAGTSDGPGTQGTGTPPASQPGTGEQPGEPGSGTGAPGDGTGTGGEGGGFIYTGEVAEADTPRGQFFPTRRGFGTLVCEAFAGEPSLEELGDDGAILNRLITEIAYKLQISPCKFAGQFCLNAGAALGTRALAIGSHAVTETGFTRQVEVNTGNLGSLQFVPTASPAIQLLRHLARVTPLISRLSETIATIYSKPEHCGKIQGFRQNEPIGWRLDFLKELTPQMEEAIGYLFVMTCRVLLLQLLRSSRTAIENRLNRFETYAPLFEQLMLTQLADVAELEQLRDRLQLFQRTMQVRDVLREADATVPGGVAVLPGSQWLEVTRQVTEALTVRPAAASAPEPTGPIGEIVIVPGDVRIRDSHNRLWTLAELEGAIATRRGLAEDIDPLVKQMTDLPEVMSRFRLAQHFGMGRTAIRAELHKILYEMLTQNMLITYRVTDDWQYAFQAGRIQENLASATISGTSFALQGIHLQAHEQLSESFQGSGYYAMGINALFHARLGAESLAAFFEFTGLVLLAVLCPPAAVAVGIGLAANQYAHALEREMLYGALINPELVITRSEVEAELFAAKLGLALSFIPEAGSILRVGSYGVRAVSRAGVAGGTRIVGRYVARRVTREMVEALSRNLTLALAREVVTNVVMDRLIATVLEPIIQHIERETSITGPIGGSQGAELVRRMLAAERRASARSPSSDQ